MSSFSFYYRSKKDIGNLSLRFIHKDLDYVLRTPFVSKKSYWYFKTTRNSKPIYKHRKVEELKGDANLKLHKNKLLEFKEKLNTQFINDLEKGVALTKDWLKQAIIKSHTIIEGLDETKKAEDILKEERKKTELIKSKNILENAILEIFVKYSSNSGELKKFKTTYSWLKKFQEYMSINYKISDFNQYFIDQFKNWAIGEENINHQQL